VTVMSIIYEYFSIQYIETQGRKKKEIYKTTKKMSTSLLFGDDTTKMSGKEQDLCGAGAGAGKVGEEPLPVQLAAANADKEELEPVHMAARRLVYFWVRSQLKDVQGQVHSSVSARQAQQQEEQLDSAAALVEKRLYQSATSLAMLLDRITLKRRIVNIIRSLPAVGVDVDRTRTNPTATGKDLPPQRNVKRRRTSIRSPQSQPQVPDTVTVVLRKGSQMKIQVAQETEEQAQVEAIQIPVAMAVAQEKLAFNTNTSRREIDIDSSSAASPSATSSVCSKLELAAVAA
jgi:hypothetical protein